MKIGICTSSTDLAGVNIKGNLLRNMKFQKYKNGLRWENIFYFETDKSLLTLKKLEFDVDLWIFGSKHKSISGKPCLTVHAPGNWTNEAQYGGSPETLAYTWPIALKKAIQYLWHETMLQNLDFDVTLEVTHHGPTDLAKPIIFIEIGSSEREWQNPDAINIVSKVIRQVAIELSNSSPEIETAAIGLGGPHYSKKFTQIMLETNFAIGHIMPKYVGEKIDPRIISEAISKSGDAKYAIIDWKGLNSITKNKILEKLKTLDVEVLKTKKLI
jgi:D-aminoacyl-tRNA deacylase